MYAQLTPKATYNALEAIRQAAPLNKTHPLRHFISLGSAEATIQHRLLRLMTTRLNRHRQLYGLTEAQPRDSIDAMRKDFHVGNSELEAWSLLYYRYVRVDLDLSFDQLEEWIGENRRTLSRRQSKGLRRLTDTLVNIENRTRQRQKAAELAARLPVATTLFGRESALNAALDTLCGATMPRQLLICGQSGIGKTALAVNIAHQLAAQAPVKNLAWIEQPEPTFPRLVEQITLALGLCDSPDSLSFSLPDLKVYVQLTDCLIGIDNADQIEPSSLLALLSLLGSARVIMCAHEIPTLDSDITYLPLHELEPEACIALLDDQAKRQSIGPLSDTRLEQLINEIGGNPRGLRMALAGGKRSASAVISAEVYRRVWSELSDEAQRLWLILGIVPLDSAASEILVSSAAYDALESAGVIALDDGNRLTRLTPLALTFAQSYPGDALFISAIRCLADYLIENPSPKACMCLLGGAQRADLAIGLRLDLAHAFGPIICHAGAWVLWSAYLESLLNLVSGADRLWLTLQLGIARRWLAQFPVAIDDLSVVIKGAGSTGDFLLQTEAMVELAVIYRAQKHFDQADQLLAAAESLFERRKLTQQQERVAVERLQLRLDRGEWANAEEYLSNLSAKRPVLSPRLGALAAQLALHRGDLKAALDWATAAQTELGDDLPHLARLMALMGQIHARLDDPDSAIYWLTSALDLMEKCHDLLGRARVQLNLAAVYIAQGQLWMAMKLLRNLPIEFERLGDAESLAVTLKNLELIEAMRRRPCP